jgi:hypothetical protein
MLAGRNDLAPLRRYVKNFDIFSDDKLTLNGAYGFRWRKEFGRDQLSIIAKRLRENPDDRRSVLQMWDASRDLNNTSLDVPCNLVCTFQRGIAGELNIVVFCRSNDILFGAYFANAFQFGMLLEYVALAIGCPVGTYTQISVNWHGYISTLESVKDIRPDHVNYIDNPYVDGRVHTIPMIGPIEDLDESIHLLLHDADAGFGHGTYWPREEWARNAYCVLRAHESYRVGVGENKYKEPLLILSEGDQRCDWVVAAKEWIQRRYTKFQMKKIMSGELEHP